MNIDKYFLSYLSGYFDGDGCFFIRKETLKNRFKYPSQFIIISTNVEVLQYIKENIGGSITVGCKREKFPGQKIQYRFCLCGKKSADIAELILPFLIEKKEECLCYIDFIRTDCKIKKDTIIEKMKYLKKSFNLVTKEDTESLKIIKRTKKTNDYDFSYLAGFIDAECSIGIIRYHMKNRENFLYKIVLALSNTKLPCFFFLMSRFGGSICFVQKNGIHRNQLSYKLTANALHKILPKIHPFLRNKKPICEQLIKFKNLILINGGARHTEIFRDSYKSNLIERDKIFNIVRQLNHRGLKSV